MAKGIRTGNRRGFNKRRSSKFRVGSRVRQTPEEGRRTYQPKHCGNNNKDEGNCPKTLNVKNHQASSQKFAQLMSIYIYIYIYIYIEQVLAATPHKAPTIRPPASHHENYPS